MYDMYRSGERERERGAVHLNQIKPRQSDLALESEPKVHLNIRLVRPKKIQFENVS